MAISVWLAQAGVAERCLLSLATDLVRRRYHASRGVVDRKYIIICYRRPVAFTIVQGSIHGAHGWAAATNPAEVAGSGLQSGAMHHLF